MPNRRPTGKLADLSGLRIFSGLTARTLQDVAANLDEITVEPEATLVQEGKHNDTFWIILEGELELTIGERVREPLGPGDIIGLPSLFSGLEANSTIVAKSPVRALVASHTQFNHFIGDPELEIRFKAALFERLRDEVYQLTHGGTSAPASRRRRK